MKKECIILAGGFGTRLQRVVADVPKPMAPVAGKPFLEYIFQYLHRNGIERVVLSVGYKHETIAAHFGGAYKDIKIAYSIEDTPLGTGGAIYKSLQLCKEESVLILNGDTFFDISIHDLYEQHTTEKNNLTIAAKHLIDFDRYGTLVLAENNQILSFREKQPMAAGLINGGVYLLKRAYLLDINLPQKFSFEQDILEKHCASDAFFAYTGSSDRYFIDIGIPEDFARAQIEFAKPY
jgi:D-glycero-alpha-D-manno-heptose 1-phosphate guanylyltransferase